MVASRGASYTCDEDRHLCNVCINISQDPIMSANRRRDQFWASVTTTYNSTKPNLVMQNRNQRSLQSRMHTIHQAVSKLNECIRQIQCREDENGGASELDILNRARLLLRQNPKFKSGFKFDHVWSIMKDIDKFPPKKQRRRINYMGSFHLDAVPESPIPPPPESSSFSVNASDENVSGGSSSQELKEAKRRKGEEDIPSVIKLFQEENKKLRDLLTSREEERQRYSELQRRKIEVQMLLIEVEKQKIEQAYRDEENKILMLNLDTISDPRIREYFRRQQEKIVQKREATIKASI